MHKTFTKKFMEQHITVSCRRQDLISCGASNKGVVFKGSH